MKTKRKMIHTIPGLSSTTLELSVSVLYLPLSNMWILTTGNAPSVTEKLSFQFYSTLN